MLWAQGCFPSSLIAQSTQRLLRVGSLKLLSLCKFIGSAPYRAIREPPAPATLSTQVIGAKESGRIDRWGRRMYNVEREAKGMDERALIINAIKEKKQNTPEVDFDFPESDVIEMWVKRKKRQESFKGKQIDDWTNVDFLRYLDYMLKEFGVVRAKENTRRDSDKINHLYDRLVKQLTVEMSNSILKEFLEWWCSIWAPRLTGSEFHLNLLIQEYQVTRFASRYDKNDIPLAPSVISTKQTVAPSPPISDDGIYDLGGLGLLLMKRGLVIGYRILKSRGVLHVDKTMEKTIGQFSKEVLISVLKITFRGSPYPESDRVDFISFATSALDRFGLTDYAQVQYGTYFKE